MRRPNSSFRPKPLRDSAQFRRSTTNAKVRGDRTVSEFEQVRDREAVIEVVNKLFVAVDARDWTLAHQCLAEKVHFDMTSLGDSGPSLRAAREITAAWQSGLASLEAIHHQSGNFVVHVVGDKADCSCYGIAYHFRRVRSGRNTRLFVGSYDYDLSRSGESWRITRFKFNLKFVDGNLELDREEPA